MIYQVDRVAELWGAVMRQAVLDHRAGYHRQGTPSAYTFLRSAGLVDARGQLVGRARTIAPRRTKRGDGVKRPHTGLIN